MPSQEKTQNLGLNQWKSNEYVKRQDFVEDNVKIDEAFGVLEGDIQNLSDSVEAQGQSLGDINTSINALGDGFVGHKADAGNPHAVTKSQVGLANVENKSAATIRQQTDQIRMEVASSVGSLTPTQGRLVFETSTGKAKVGNGSAWLNVGEPENYNESGNINIFVSTTGNDSNDGATSGTALRTIAAAVNKIKRVNAGSVSIYVTSGTYDGSFNFDRIIAPVVTLTRLSSGTVTINGDADVTECVGKIRIVNMTFAAGKYVKVDNCSGLVDILGCNFSSVSTGLGAIYITSSRVSISTTNISNSDYGISAFSSFVTMSSVSGSGNTIGVLSSNSIIMKGNSTISGSTAEQKRGGGQIFSGSY